MKYKVSIALMAIVGLGLPIISKAQDSGGVAGQINGLQGVLDKVYDDMLPLCGSLTAGHKIIAPPMTNGRKRG